MKPMDPGDAKGGTPPDPPVEQVLVVPREEILGVADLPQGYREGRTGSILRRIDRFGRFVPRPEAEHDPGLKQIIPYCYLTWEGKVLMLRRLRTQTEARLHDRLSIGVGGHINPGEVDPGPPETRLPGAPGSPIERGALRELHEELRLGSPYALEIRGTLNDDSNPVGRVHFGIVFEVALAGGDVEVAEKDRMTGEMVRVSDLAGFRDEMETWSQHLTDHLLRRLASPGAHGGRTGGL